MADAALANIEDGLTAVQGSALKLRRPWCCFIVLTFATVIICAGGNPLVAMVAIPTRLPPVSDRPQPATQRSPAGRQKVERDIVSEPPSAAATATPTAVPTGVVGRVPTCGDGRCDPPEDVESCLADCPGVTTAGHCGEEPHSDPGGEAVVWGLTHKTACGVVLGRKRRARPAVAASSPCPHPSRHRVRHSRVPRLLNDAWALGAAAVLRRSAVPSVRRTRRTPSTPSRATAGSSARWPSAGPSTLATGTPTASAGSSGKWTPCALFTASAAVTPTPSGRDTRTPTSKGATRTARRATSPSRPTCARSRVAG